MLSEPASRKRDVFIHHALPRAALRFALGYLPLRRRKRQEQRPISIHSCNGVYICPKSLPSLPTSKANTLDRLQDGDLVLADASEDTIGISKSVEIVDTDGFELVAGLHTIAV
jgi:hypothetical protein